MSEDAAPPQPAAEDTTQAGGAHGRRRSVTFVLVFMSIVLVLLMGYRFNVDTPYNDWYLFQVARHTVSTLALLGDSAELEYGRDDLGDPQKIRAQLAVWQRGEETVTPSDYIAAAAGPLSAWEAWQYRSHQARVNNSPAEHGPKVQFVYKRGLAIEVRELDEKLRKLEASGDGSAAELGALRAELQEKRKTLHAHRTDPDFEHGDPTYMFYFIVVSECGAIEVMAIFLAAVIAFPTRLWKKLVGILLGLPIMYCVNIFRLTCLAMIGALDTRHMYFNFFHEYVWQAVYIIFVVAVWLVWVEYLVRGRWRRGAGAEVTTEGAGSHE